MFRIGDKVVVICTRDTTGYEHTRDKIGSVVDIKSYEKNGKTWDKIYVDLSPLHNPAQEQGLFIFKKEELVILSAEEPPIWRCDVATFREEELKPYIKIKEEKKEMELLEIYMDRKQRQLEIEHDKKQDKIKAKDPVIKELAALSKKYKDVKGLSIFANFEYQFSEEILQELNKNDYNYRVQREKLNSLEREINAQLDICETYEQKMGVLITYGVLDEQGKLNV